MPGFNLLLLLLLLAGERGRRLGEREDDAEDADAAEKGTGLMVRRTLFIMVKAGIGLLLLVAVEEEGPPLFIYAALAVAMATFTCDFLLRPPCSMGQ
jgi:hypothetical protein